MLGSVLLQSPSMHDFDQREMFCLYLLPGNQQNRKVSLVLIHFWRHLFIIVLPIIVASSYSVWQVFRKDVVFVVDISGSMRGKLLEDAKSALSTALHKLDPEDSFSILAFNSEVYQYSTSMVLATSEAIKGAIEWINNNFIAGSGTDILQPLNKVLSSSIFWDYKVNISSHCKVTQYSMPGKRQTMMTFPGVAMICSGSIKPDEAFGILSQWRKVPHRILVLHHSRNEISCWHRESCPWFFNNFYRRELCSAFI